MSDRPVPVEELLDADDYAVMAEDEAGTPASQADAAGEADSE